MLHNCTRRNARTDILISPISRNSTPASVSAALSNTGVACAANNAAASPQSPVHPRKCWAEMRPVNTSVPRIPVCAHAVRRSPRRGGCVPSVTTPCMNVATSRHGGGSSTEQHPKPYSSVRLNTRPLRVWRGSANSEQSSAAAAHTGSAEAITVLKHRHHRLVLSDGAQHPTQRTDPIQRLQQHKTHSSPSPLLDKTFHSRTSSSSPMTMGSATAAAAAPAGNASACWSSSSTEDLSGWKAGSLHLRLNMPVPSGTG